MADKQNTELPFDKLERCFHEPARLAALSLLVNSSEGISYSDLRSQLNLTYGNLERHMKVLSAAGMIEITKINDQGRPKSIAKMSMNGRNNFLRYLENLEKILKTAQGKLAETKESNPEVSGETNAALA
ncbi:MAG: transcriptional regulator [Verrucomicrobia bacterium]|nr:transcriptional regulator [Verrucomicrobiota bacterium]